jgi:HMG (high mobility group) box
MDSSRRKRTEPKKWEWKKPDGFPKRPLHAYNCFYRDERKRIIEDNTGLLGGLTGLSAIISKRWKDLPMDLKEPYLNEAKEEKDLYDDAVRCWKKDNEPRKKRVRKRKSKVTQQQKDNQELHRTMSLGGCTVGVANFPLSSSNSLPARLGDDHLHPPTSEYYSYQYYHHHWPDTSLKYPALPIQSATYNEPFTSECSQTINHRFYNESVPHYTHYHHRDRLLYTRSGSNSPDGTHTDSTVWHQNTSSDEKPNPLCCESLSSPAIHSSRDDFYSSKFAQRITRGFSSDSSVSSSYKESFPPLKSFQAPTDIGCTPTSVAVDSEAISSELDQINSTPTDCKHTIEMLPRHAADIHLAYFPSDRENAGRYM